MAWLFELFLVFVDPTASSAVGALIVGAPEMAPELVGICRRESHCRWIGAHPGDAWAGATMQRKALEVGWLDRGCRHHRGAADRYSTHGVHGLSAAYSLRFIPGCLPPEILDIPLVSAVVAARRAQHQCRTQAACTAAARHRHWVGARRFDRRAAAARRGRK